MRLVVNCSFLVSSLFIAYRLTAFQGNYIQGRKDVPMAERKISHSLTHLLHFFFNDYEEEMALTLNN